MKKIQLGDTVSFSRVTKNASTEEVEDQGRVVGISETRDAYVVLTGAGTINDIWRVPAAFVYN